MFKGGVGQLEDINDGDQLTIGLNNGQIEVMTIWGDGQVTESWGSQGTHCASFSMRREWSSKEGQCRGVGS